MADIDLKIFFLEVHASFQVYFVKEEFYKAYDYSERAQNDLKAKILQNVSYLIIH